MNQPNDPRFDKLEQRVEKIEQVFDDIVESEKMIIKLSKRQNFNMQELSGKVGNLGLDIGDMRERFDTIERTMATKEDLTALKTTQAQHSERFDTIERIMATKANMTEYQAENRERFDTIERTMATKEDLAALKTTQAQHSERFDTIERIMATKEDLAALKTTLFEILDRLPPKQ